MDADAYHRAIEALMQALFYPALVNPVRESRIHNGRKRIDIRFSNNARDGFFWRIHAHHDVPAGYVVVECKNYSEDVANPEVGDRLKLDHYRHPFAPSFSSFVTPANVHQSCSLPSAGGWHDSSLPT